MDLIYSSSPGSVLNRIMDKFDEAEIIHKLGQSISFSEENPDFVGIGDDAAVLPRSIFKDNIVISTDSLVEGVHFLRDKISPRDLAFKSLAVNLSDLAAMGAEQKFVMLSISLPQKTSDDWIEEFLESFKANAKMWNVVIIGGDTTSSKEDLFINVTVIGEANKKNIKLRTGARPGDKICVTKTLGDSAMGLDLLMDKNKNIEEPLLIDRHCRPTPHLEEGRFLSQFEAVHAMMDLSDGLWIDLPKMAARSSCGLEVQTDCLPISSPLRAACRQLVRSEKDMAIVGGEDYALLVAVDGMACEEIKQKYLVEFNTPLFEIGIVTNAAVRYLYNDREYLPRQEAFMHFARK